MQAINSIKRHFEDTYIHFVLASFFILVLGLSYSNKIVIGLGMFALLIFTFVPFKLIFKISQMDKLSTTENSDG